MIGGPIIGGTISGIVAGGTVEPIGPAGRTAGTVDTAGAVGPQPDAVSAAGTVTGKGGPVGAIAVPGPRGLTPPAHNACQICSPNVLKEGIAGLSGAGGGLGAERLSPSLAPNTASKVNHTRRSAMPREVKLSWRTVTRDAAVAAVQCQHVFSILKQVSFPDGQVSSEGLYRIGNKMRSMLFGEEPQGFLPQKTRSKCARWPLLWGSRGAKEIRGQEPC